MASTDQLRQVSQRTKPFGVSGTGYDDPISTFFGTAAEGLIDTLSLGFYQPDIIPEAQEQADPWASMAGRISGTIAGFLPALGAARGVVTVGLGATKWGRGLLGGAKALSGLKQTGAAFNVARGIGTAAQEGAAFALHDVAREFIRQTKESDPNAYELGMAAVKGATLGGMFGFVHTSTKFMNPINQIVAGSATFASAEAIGLSMEGEDITIEDMAKSAMIGGVLTLASLPGLKKRRLAKTQEGYAELPEFVEQMNNPKSDWLKMWKETVETKVGPVPEMQELIGKAMAFRKVAGKAPFNVSATSAGKKVAIKGSSSYGGRLMNTFKQMGIERAERLEVASGVLGRPVKSFKGLTNNEASLIMDDVIKYAEKTFEGLHMDIMGTVSDAAAKGGKRLRGVKPTGLRHTGLGFTENVDTAIRRKGLTDIIQNAENAVRAATVEGGKMKNMFGSMLQEWEQITGVTTKQKIGAFVKNRPLDQLERLKSILTIDDPKKFTDVLRGLSDAERNIVKNMRKLTDTAFFRNNRALIAGGEQPIAYREGYWRRMTNMEEVTGKTSAQLATEKRVRRKTMGKGAEKPQMGKEGPLFERTAPDAIERMDRKMFQKAFNNMVDNEMQTTWLHRPQDLIVQRVEYLKKIKMITQAEVDAVYTWTDAVVANRRPDHSVILNNRLKNAIDNTKIGNAFTAVLDKFGRTVGERPADAFVSMYGRGITAGMIKFRPVQAIRNKFQVTHMLSFASTKNIAKAMTGDMPVELATMLKNSPEQIYNVSKMGMAQDVETQGLFGRAHISNVEMSAKAMYYQVSDNIIKGIKGYADDAGKALRANSKNKNIFSTHEKMIQLKETEHIINHTQFLYHITGMPGMYNSTEGKFFGKLMSYPMNYWHKFLKESWHRMTVGSPSWDTAKTIKIPWEQRAGLVKYWVGTSILVGAMSKGLGLDYTSILGLSVTDRDNAKVPIPYTDKGIKLGVFGIRPNPGTTAFLALTDLVSGDDYEQSMAWRELSSLIPASTVPGWLAVKDVGKTIDKGEPGRLLFKYNYEPRKKKRTTHGMQPFKAFGK